jgi:hypothetical protein
VKRTPIQLQQKDIQKIREKILKKQNGLCAICQQIPEKPCLDHHHKKRVKGTGLIRGVLCNSCNVFIAKSENNAIRYGVTNIQLPERLRAFADYLEKRQYPFMHPDEAPPIPKLMKSSYNELKKQLKDVQYKKKIPDFPKSGKMIKPLQILYDAVRLLPRFYKK